VVANNVLDKNSFPKLEDLVRQLCSQQKPAQKPALKPAQKPAQCCPQDLKEETVKWVKDNGNENTKQTYAPYAQQFKDFCAERGLEAVPATDVTLVAFMRYLHEERKLAKNTILLAVSAVADLHKLTGAKNPADSDLVRAAKKIIRVQAKSEKKKKPLEPAMIHSFAGKADEKKFTEARDMLVILTLWCGMRRESEVVALKAEDVWLEDVKLKDGSTEAALFLFVEKAKNDQERKGHTVVIGSSPDKQICPVRWYKAYTELRNPAAAAFFHQEKKMEALSKTTPNQIVKKWLKKIGVDPKLYGSHSGRIGGATYAKLAGVETNKIKKQGNWASDAVYGYFQTDWMHQIDVSKSLLTFEMEKPKEK
jgi:site-specific recombinase XerD